MPVPAAMFDGPAAVRFRSAGRAVVRRECGHGLHAGVRRDLIYLRWKKVSPGQQAEAVLATLADAIPLALVLRTRPAKLVWANAAAVERGGDHCAD